MIVDVTGNLEDAELYTERVEPEAIAFTQVTGYVRVVRMSSSIYRDVVYFAQFRDATYMVGVAVGAQDGIQLKVVVIQELQHGCCLAGIDHSGLHAVVYGPDVIVLQCRDGGNVEHGCIRMVRGDAEL